MVSLPGDEPGAFWCPKQPGRCALRVIDPALRPERSTGETDDQLGLLTVPRWLASLAPTPTAPVADGISLELSPWAQYLPQTLDPTPGRAAPQRVLGAPDACAPETLLGAMAANTSVARVVARRRVFAIQDHDARTRDVTVEGVPEPLLASGPAADVLGQLFESQGLAAVTFDPATRVVIDARDAALSPVSRCFEAFGDVTAR